MSNVVVYLALVAVIVGLWLFVSFGRHLSARKLHTEVSNNLARANDRRTAGHHRADTGADTGTNYRAGHRADSGAHTYSHVNGNGRSRSHRSDS